MQTEEYSGEVLMTTIDFQKQIEEFQQSILNVSDRDDILRTLTSKGLGGSLKHSHIRSLCWRLFLGVIPESIDEWSSVIEKHRQHYEDLVQRHIVDPRNTKVEEEDDLIENNPLSQSESNPWSQFFENSELDKVIDQDLKRLYPEYEFYRDEEVIKLMQRALFLWAKENPDTSYRQGMHELLAPFVLVFTRDSKHLEKSASAELSSEEERSVEILRNVFNPKYLEHDCYIAFERLMIKMKEYFLVVNVPRQKHKDVTGLLSHANLLDESIAKTPLHQMCNRIHALLLARKDKELYDHIESLNIEPQIFLLRWIRLLFGREFHIEDVLVVWDAIFADSGGFRNSDLDPMTIDLSLVEHLAIMMLVYIRSQLLELDFSDCLKRLMKYPPVEDVHLFVERALQSRNRPYDKLTFNDQKVQTTVHPLATPTTNSSSGTTTTSTSSQKSSASQGTDKRKQKIKSSLFSKPPHNLFRVGTSDKKPSASPSVSSSLFTTTPKATEADHPAVKNFIDKELELGNHMEKVIDLMQRLVLEREKGFDENAFFMSLAELKHIRDILKFQLPAQSMSLDWMNDYTSTTTASTASTSTQTNTETTKSKSLQQHDHDHESSSSSTTSSPQVTDEDGDIINDPLTL
jgi:hypothetical protein